MKRPLSGLRVLDASIYLSGPYVSLLLGGMGAEVIKVERPLYGDPTRRTPPFVAQEGVNFDGGGTEAQSVTFLKRNRNKRSMTLNLKTEQGRDLFKRLAAVSDVVLENFRVGVMERLGLSYERLRPLNEGLIYCSISGFGQTGPYREFTALDPVIQAMSGLMAVTGTPDGEPLRCGVSLGDLVASLYALIGILAALHHRQLTGEGQYLDVSMLDGLFSLVFDEPLDVFEQHGIPIRTGNRRSRLTPNNSYATADGFVIIGTAADDQWAAVLRAMGRGELAQAGFYARLSERMESAAAVDAFVQDWTRRLPSREVVERLRAEGVPCGPVATVPNLLADPQLRSRHMVEPLPHPAFGQIEAVSGFGFPIGFSTLQAGFDRGAPRLGEHTEGILTEMLGLSRDSVERLRRDGVI